jgi:hypothetical protein
MVPEEKRTDVSIATFMLDDAYQDTCDHLILTQWRLRSSASGQHGENAIPA